MADANVKKEVKAEAVVKTPKMTPAQMAAYFEEIKAEQARRDDVFWLKYYVKIIF